MGLDGDAAGVDFGGSPQRLLDLAPDFHRRDLRLDFDVIGNSPNSAHATAGGFSPLTLVIPFNLAFQRQPAVLHNDPDLFPRIRQIGLDLRDGISGDFGVRPFVDAGQADFDIVDNPDDARDAFRVALPPGTFA
jgi:hypothetical protein